MKPLCIYHKNCADGFGAAWVVRKFYGQDGVDLHPATYQEAPPDVTGRDVIMVDFSFKRPIMEQLIEQAKSVLIIDHHKTAMADLANLQGTAPSWVIFDMDHSGAVLTWMHFFPGQPVPALLDYIGDRDIWRFQLPRSREVAAGLFSHPYDFAVWDGFMDGGAAMVTLLADDGRAIERKHHKDIAELVAASARPMIIGGHQVLAANLPYTMSSDAGHMLVDQGSLFGACYSDGPNGRTFSLRSTDGGPDVSEIAKLYGGGGHRNAAGFRVSFVDAAQFEVPTR